MIKLDKRLEISFKFLREKLSELLSRDAMFVEEVSISGFVEALDYDETCEYYFISFLSHFSHLESLTMKGSGPITDDHLKLVGGKLKKLQRLSIYINTSITDIGLSYLSGENNLSGEVSCPLLQSLEIDRASGITSKGI